MNCLSYALRFWKENTDYKIWYNSDHCINIPIYLNATFEVNNRFERYTIDTVDGHQVSSSVVSLGIPFIPAEEFGYTYFLSAFKDQLTEEDIDILKEYFKKS